MSELIKLTAAPINAAADGTPILVRTDQITSVYRHPANTHTIVSMGAMYLLVSESPDVVWDMLRQIATMEALSQGSA